VSSFLDNFPWDKAALDATDQTDAHLRLATAHIALAATHIERAVQLKRAKEYCEKRQRERQVEVPAK
jgi:hypothetical protein